MKLNDILKGKSSLIFALAILLPVSSVQAHSGLTAGIVWEVCEDKPRSESCEYKNAHGDLYIGTCQSISAHMMCVRNKPIIKSETKETHDTPDTNVEGETPESKKEPQEASEAPNN